MRKGARPVMGGVGMLCSASCTEQPAWGISIPSSSLFLESKEPKIADLYLFRGCRGGVLFLSFLLAPTNFTFLGKPN